MSEHHSQMARGDGAREAARRGRLAVLGLGQLGGSFALAGRAAGLFDEVVGFGRREASLRRARERGLADRTTTSAAEAVTGAATVLVATPLGAVADTVRAAAPGLAPGALVLDVGSVKGTATRDIEALLPAGVDFVSGHPLAGTENFGPDAATAELFRGRACILCPNPRTRGEALARATELWTKVGARVVQMPADLHDIVMGSVSHLPHVVAYGLAATISDLPGDIAAAAAGLTTTSLRDTTRIAASSPVMWRDIFLENRAALIPLFDDLLGGLQELRDAIVAGDGARVESFLERGRKARTRFFPA